MTYENFLTSVMELAPGCKPEAVPRWQDFAVECVESEQFVRFQQTEDKATAVERWLDVLSSGLQAVGDECGPKTAAAVVGLSLEHCCLYPGEMMQAALCLEHGGDAKEISRKIENGEIDCTDLFSPISRREAEGRRAVRERLNAPKKSGQQKKGGER
ncbi:MAG: hypothetical protein NC489_32985 [Ruminococcus flavefaciens]|nr:hypothetical protein [Ruminococcus flavefaciens]